MWNRSVLTLTVCAILLQHLVQSQRIGEFQLRGCSGTLEVYRNGLIYGERFYDICDSNFGDEEAQVVCRQLGCSPVGARRTFSGPGFGIITFVTEGYSCSGSESSLSSCRSTPGSCSVRSRITSENQGQFVTVTCGPLPPSEPQDLLVDVVSAFILNATWNQPLHTNNGGFVSMYQVILDGRVLATLTVDLRSSFRLQSYLIRNLDENTTYIVQVKGSNNGGFGPAATANATTQSLSDPQRILDDPEVQVHGPTIFVVWEYPGGTVNNYVIEYRRVSDAEVTLIFVNGSDTSTYIDDLLPGLYKLRIAVENDNGLSDYGSTILFIVSRKSINNERTSGENTGATTTFFGASRATTGSQNEYFEGNFGGNNGVSATLASESVLLMGLLVWGTIFKGYY